MPSEFKITNCRSKFLFGFSQSRLIFHVGKGGEAGTESAKDGQKQEPRTLTVDQLKDVVKGSEADMAIRRHALRTEAAEVTAQNRRAGLAAEIGVGITPSNSPSALKDSEESKERPLSKLTGHEFIEKMKSMKPEEREKAIEEAITKENIPAFKDVEFKFKDASGKEHKAQFSITKDVIKVGVPGDPNNPQMRMPMTPITAERIAERFGCMLPTSDVIDHTLRDPGFIRVAMPISRDIGIPDVEVTVPERQSDGSIKMVKKMAPDGKLMQDPAKYELHNEAINGAVSLQDLTGLMTQSEGKGLIGHKKVIVIGAGLNGGETKLNFHGGLKPDLQNFYQNNGLQHEWTYADYSHGVYLVKKEWVIDGEKKDVSWVIKNYPGVVGKVGLSEDVNSYYKQNIRAQASASKTKPAEIQSKPLTSSQIAAEARPLTTQVAPESSPQARPVNRSSGIKMDRVAGEAPLVTPPAVNSPTASIAPSVPPALTRTSNQVARTETARPLETAPNINEINIPAGKKLFILGDSHSGGFTRILKSKFATEPSKIAHLHHKKSSNESLTYDTSDGQNLDDIIRAFNEVLNGTYPLYNLPRRGVLNDMLQGSTAVIEIGTNDIYGGASLETVKTKFDFLITLLKSKGMKVIVATVPGLMDHPDTKKAPQSMSQKDQTRKAFNDYLRTQNQKGTYDGFVDLEEVGLVKPDGHNTSRGTTLHFSPDAYSKMGEYIAQRVNQANKPT